MDSLLDSDDEGEVGGAELEAAMQDLASAFGTSPAPNDPTPAPVAPNAPVPTPAYAPAPAPVPPAQEPQSAPVGATASQPLNQAKQEVLSEAQSVAQQQAAAREVQRQLQVKQQQQQEAAKAHAQQQAQQQAQLKAQQQAQQQAHLQAQQQAQIQAQQQAQQQQAQQQANLASSQQRHNLAAAPASSGTAPAEPPSVARHSSSGLSVSSVYQELKQLLSEAKLLELKRVIQELQAAPQQTPEAKKDWFKKFVAVAGQDAWQTAMHRMQQKKAAPAAGAPAVAAGAPGAAAPVPRRELSREDVFRAMKPELQADIRKYTNYMNKPDCPADKKAQIQQKLSQTFAHVKQQLLKKLEQQQQQGSAGAADANRKRSHAELQQGMSLADMQQQQRQAQGMSIADMQRQQQQQQQRQAQGMSIADMQRQQQQQQPAQLPAHQPLQGMSLADMVRSNQPKRPAPQQLTPQQHQMQQQQFAAQAQAQLTPQQLQQQQQQQQQRQHQLQQQQARQQMQQQQQQQQQQQPINPEDELYFLRKSELLKRIQFKCQQTGLLAQVNDAVVGYLCSATERWMTGLLEDAMKMTRQRTTEQDLDVTYITADPMKQIDDLMRSENERAAEREDLPQDERINLVRGKPNDGKSAEERKEARKKQIQQEKIRNERVDQKAALNSALNSRRKVPPPVPTAAPMAAEMLDAGGRGRGRGKGKGGRKAKPTVNDATKNQVTDRDLQLVLDSRKAITKSRQAFRFASGTIHNTF